MRIRNPVPTSHHKGHHPCLSPFLAQLVLAQTSCGVHPCRIPFKPLCIIRCIIMDSGPAFNVGRTGASLIPGSDVSILNPGMFVCGCGHQPRSERGEEPHMLGIVYRELFVARSSSRHIPMQVYASVLPRLAYSGPSDKIHG